MCKLGFMPETCGFKDCLFSWAGTKIVNGRPKKIKNNPWQEAKQEFKYFDKDENGTAKWISLKILVKGWVNNYALEKCGLCLEKNDSSCKTLECNHKYHTKCLDSLEFNLKIKCVLC